jgi:hypothetical protein
MVGDNGEVYLFTNTIRHFYTCFMSLRREHRTVDVLPLGSLGCTLHPRKSWFILEFYLKFSLCCNLNLFYFSSHQQGIRIPFFCITKTHNFFHIFLLYAPLGNHIPNPIYPSHIESFWSLGLACRRNVFLGRQWRKFEAVWS